MTAARIVALLALADEAPEVDELVPYLTDADPEVRRTALAVLSEAAEDWSAGSVWPARALLDADAGVRATGIELLAELREVLLADEAFARVLREAARHADPAVRVAAVGAQWRHRLLDAAEAVRYLADPSVPVRVEAVAALVSLGAGVAHSDGTADLAAVGAALPGAAGDPARVPAAVPDGHGDPARVRAGLSDAAGDPAPEVRAAVAAGLAGGGDQATLGRLARDPERPVVSAALTALGRAGCPPDAAALAADALRDPHWQVREAAAKALAGAAPEHATEPLLTALEDQNIDVRKAAVRGLIDVRKAAVRDLGDLAPEHPGLAEALRRATEDPDADVRAYARLALEERGTRLPSVRPARRAREKEATA